MTPPITGHPTLWTSVAHWPKGTCDFDHNRSTDTHDSRGAAEAVCGMLQRMGFGTDGLVFPIRTEVIPPTGTPAAVTTEQEPKRFVVVFNNGVDPVKEEWFSTEEGARQWASIGGTKNCRLYRLLDAGERIAEGDESLDAPTRNSNNWGPCGIIGVRVAQGMFGHFRRPIHFPTHNQKER